MRVQSGLSRRLWLLLLQEGGRWNTADMADALGDDVTLVCGTARSLVDAQMLRRYGREKSASGRVEYGITHDCRIPIGISIADVAASGALSAVL